MSDLFPLGVVAQGVVFGATSGLLALGLVLTYQASRIVNFAHGAIGSLGGALGVSLYLGTGWPWWAAVLVGVAAGGAAGGVVDVLVVRRFATASRLTLTVATIGVAQVAGGVSLMIPGWLGAPVLVGAFDTGLSDVSFRVRPVLFTGNEILMLAVVPVVVGGLAWLLGTTDVGVAVRAAAQNRDRARLLGVPVRRLSTVVWALSGALAAVTVLLVAPGQGMSNSVGVAPVVLLPALAAAVVARMSSLGVAFGTAVALGVVDQLVRWHVEAKSVTTIVFLGVIVAALLLRRDHGQDEAGETALTSGGEAAMSGAWASARQHRPVRVTRRAAMVLAVVAAVAAPHLLSTGDVFLVSTGAVYAMVAASLVVLTGWAGQVSLGQFAFVGVGGVVAANLALRFNLDLFWVLAVAGVAGAVAATLIGLPALRIRGPFLAVTTLAFAVAADSYALNPANFDEWLPFSLDRPVLLGRFDLRSELSFAYLTLAMLAITLTIAAGLRRGRPGRCLVAVRDNPRGAAALAVSSTRTRLTAFVFAGAVAGVAGGLHVHLLGGLGAHTYSPSTSLGLFSMAVIGGIGSLPGAVAGVAAVVVVGRLFPDHQVILTGAGVLVLLLVLPGGLAALGRRVRDRIVRLTGLAGAESPASPAIPPSSERGTRAHPEAGSTVGAGDGILECTGIEAAYGQLQVLFGVDLAVGEGEVVALLGTNGAGKSTLLRTVTGLLPSGAGAVRFAGRRIDGLQPEAIARLGVAMVPGGRAVFPSLTVEENLRVAGWLLRSDAPLLAKRRAEVLERFPALRDRLDQDAGSLSGGEQQMLALAQAFLGRPQLLLIDELSLGLAPAVVAELLEVVRAQAAGGTTVVLVEQSVNVALTLADRAVFLEKGEVRFSGPTVDLLDRPEVLRAVFLPTATAHRTIARPRTAEATDEEVPLALSCRGLVKRFGGVTACAGVDLDVAGGQIVGLIGHNGAGKTTLVDIVSGFVVPDAGTVLLDQRDVTACSPAQRAVAGLGRSFQEARLFAGLTVVETLAVALDRHLAGRGDGLVASGLRLPAATDAERLVRTRVADMVDQLSLGAFATTPLAGLSTGTRRIVELGCMLALEPRVLLLDEPSAGVAQRETEALGPLLLQVRDETGCSIVVIEHDMALIASLCDDLVALEHGAVIAKGTPPEVLAHPRVLASYLGTDHATIARSGPRR